MLIEAARMPGAASALLYDYELHWRALGGCEHNWFALASQYDTYQLGLTEDLRVLDTPRYQAVASLAVGDSSPGASGSKLNDGGSAPNPP